MKLLFNGDRLIVTREPGDTKIYGGIIGGRGESNLLHKIKVALIAMGYDVIKKRMHKDGHLVDELQQYIRSRNNKCAGNFALHNGHWAVAGLDERWNEDGVVELVLTKPIFVDD